MNGPEDDRTYTESPGGNVRLNEGLGARTNTIFLALVIGRMFVAAVAMAGAAWLASAGKEWWGWLIFAGIVIGGSTFTTDSKEVA